MFYEETRIKQDLTYLHIILLIKDYLRQQIHFKGGILGKQMLLL